MSWPATRYNGSQKPLYRKQIEELPVQQLPNGAMGIDFHSLSKPPNLANSEVLKMLEEEKYQKMRRGPEVKEVIWPPPESTEQYVEYHPVDSCNTQHSPAYNMQATSNGFNTGCNAEYQKSNGRPLFSPPPTTITLRDSVPINQTTTPVFISQPAAASIKGSAKCRGDQKWPPENYKAPPSSGGNKIENQARMQLARGPVFRPRKVQKDYESFFAQNALPTSYPSYKAPPGTQHYYESNATDF